MREVFKVDFIRSDTKKKTTVKVDYGDKLSADLFANSLKRSGRKANVYSIIKNF